MLRCLLLSQAPQAHHRPQLQRLRPLVPGNVDGFEKTRFGLALVSGSEGLEVCFLWAMVCVVGGPILASSGVKVLIR
jgi:hypothetical protein